MIGVFHVREDGRMARRPASCQLHARAENLNKGLQRSTQDTLVVHSICRPLFQLHAQSSEPSTVGLQAEAFWLVLYHIM